MNQKSHPSWGLILSGGAAWGIANGGVIEVLENYNLKPDYVAGSSMGAIVGGLYALGYNAKELHALMKKISLKSVAKVAKKPSKYGLLEPQLEVLIRDMVKDATIADCKIPFVCVARKINTTIDWKKTLSPIYAKTIIAEMETYIFPQETFLFDALRASSAIPIVFPAMKINEEEFIDLLNYGAVPALALRKTYDPDVVIATDTASRHPKLRKMLPPGIQMIVAHGNAELEKNIEECDVVIKPTFTYRYYRFDKSEDFYRAGKKAAQENIASIQKILR